MLEQLSKQDKKWRNIAYMLCGDKDLANDIVQDMYLYFHEVSEKKPNKQVTDWYVYQKIKGLFLDHVKKNRTKLTVRLETFDWISNEPTDEQIKELKKNLNKLDFVDKEMLLLTSEMSMRDCVDYFQKLGFTFSTMTFFYGRKKGLDKLKKIYNETTER